MKKLTAWSILVLAAICLCAPVLYAHICRKTILYDVEKSQLSCERRNVTLPPADGRLRLRVIVDHCSIDIHAGEHGVYYMPIFVGRLPSKKLEVRCEGGPVTFGRLRVHELKPIWNQEKPS